MKLLFSAFFFIGVLALNNASSSITLKRITADQLLMKQLMDNRASDPSNTMPCFNIYMPIINDILNEFATSYELCSTNADASNAQLNAEAKGNQTWISSSAQSVCDSMTTCSALDDSLAFLDCYSQVGDPNIATLFVLTNNASECAANLREQYRIVENTCETCYNASQRAYVEATTKASKDLDICLENGPPVTTTTIKPESPTTPEPEVTTTIVPETTSEVATEPPEAFEEEDLSRSAPLAPKVMTLNRTNRLRRQVLLRN